MPDVKWARDPQVERVRKMRCMIRSKRALRDIESDAILADRMNIGASTLSHKMNHGTWTCEDIRMLDKVLRFSAEELAALIRC